MIILKYLSGGAGCARCRRGSAPEAGASVCIFGILGVLPLFVLNLHIVVLILDLVVLAALVLRQVDPRKESLEKLVDQGCVHVDGVWDVLLLLLAHVLETRVNIRDVVQVESFHLIREEGLGELLVPGELEGDYVLLDVEREHVLHELFIVPALVLADEIQQEAGGRLQPKGH